MWEKEEMRVSEAKSWQEGLPKPFVWPPEGPANNMQYLTAVVYKFQEFLVTAVWSQKKRLQYICFFCTVHFPLLYSPPTSLSILQHKDGTRM